MKKFLKVFIYCTGLASLCLIMQFVASVPVTVFYVMLYSLPYVLAGKPEAIMSVDIMNIVHDSLLPSYILSVIMTFFAAWIIHAIFGRKFFERLSFNKASSFLIALSFIAGSALQMPISFILSLIESAGVAPDLFEQYSNNMEQLMNNQNLILQILAVGILAPLLEEIIFRGLILNQLRNNLPIQAAIIIQALLFGIVHLNVIQGSYAFIIGIILGLLVVWYDSLFLPVAFHMGLNLSGVILSEFGQGISDMVGIYMLIISFLLMFACMIVLKHRTKEKPAH